MGPGSLYFCNHSKWFLWPRKSHYYSSQLSPHCTNLWLEEILFNVLYLGNITAEGRLIATMAEFSLTVSLLKFINGYTNRYLLNTYYILSISLSTLHAFSHLIPHIGMFFLYLYFTDKKKRLRNVIQLENGNARTETYFSWSQH